MPWDSNAPDPAVLAQIDELQRRYVRALDLRDLRAWADCFAAQSGYVCTTRENEEQSLPVAIMLDDSRERIEDRITYVTKIWAGTFEDYTTRHFVERLVCGAGEPGVVTVESNFLVAYTTARGRSEILVAGAYFDEIVLTAAGARFRKKKAVLDTVTTPRYLVYPV